MSKKSPCSSGSSSLLPAALQDDPEKRGRGFIRNPCNIENDVLRLFSSPFRSSIDGRCEDFSRPLSKTRRRDCLQVIWPTQYKVKSAFTALIRPISSNQYSTASKVCFANPTSFLFPARSAGAGARSSTRSVARERKEATKRTVGTRKERVGTLDSVS